MHASLTGARNDRGCICSQKAHKRAVDRNLLRRRIKAVYRTNKEAFPDRADIVITVNDTGACHCLLSMTPVPPGPLTAV